jgi:hypothetical protein
LLNLPDATTMMIDAGAKVTAAEPDVSKFWIDRRPHANLCLGQWIAQYTREQLAQAGGNEFDYFLLTLTVWQFCTAELGEVVFLDFIAICLL